MDDKDLLQALRRLKVETGSLACMGCGHENSCRPRAGGRSGGRRACDLRRGPAGKILPPKENERQTHLYMYARTRSFVGP